MIERRQFLAWLLGLPVLVAFLVPAIAAGIRRHELTAELAEHSLGETDEPVSPLIQCNGKLTSPLFEWNELPICELAIKKYEI